MLSLLLNSLKNYITILTDKRDFKNTSYVLIIPHMYKKMETNKLQRYSRPVVRLFHNYNSDCGSAARRNMVLALITLPVDIRN